MIERNAFSSRPCGTPGRKRRKESIFALAGHALLRKNAPRTAQVAAADYTRRGCGPSKPPRGFRFPGIHCCSFFYEIQYTCKQRGYCRLASATSPMYRSEGAIVQETAYFVCQPRRFKDLFILHAVDREFLENNAALCPIRRRVLRLPGCPSVFFTILFHLRFSHKSSHILRWRIRSHHGIIDHSIGSGSCAPCFSDFQFNERSTNRYFAEDYHFHGSNK